MKKVNFIVFLSPHKQYEIRCWFWFAFFLMLFVLGIVGYCVFPQWLLYTSLKKEVSVLREKTKQHSDFVKKKDDDKKEYEVVRLRHNKMEKYTQQQKNPVTHLEAIIQASNGQVQLESIQLRSKECEITIVSSTAEHVHIFIKQLNASQRYRQCKLASLVYDMQKKAYRAIIKGRMVF
jgi:Tfp pilus assembly protein PilN